MSALPFAAYEAAALVAFALAFAQAARATSAPRAAVELLALAAYGLGLEAAAMRAFSSHVYSPGWHVVLLGVPLAVVAVWAALIPAALALAARLGARTPAGRAALAALLAIDLDLLMEPVAVAAGLWDWTPRGEWLFVPVGNFVGWAVIVGVYAYGAERWSRTRALLAEAVARVLLGALAVAALLTVGGLWRRAGMERMFTSVSSWVPWALVVVSLLVRAATARPADFSGYGGRLASAGPGRPVAVFLLVAALFTAQAVLCGRPALLVAALGAVCALGLSVRAASRAT